MRRIVRDGGRPILNPAGLLVRRLAAGLVEQRLRLVLSLPIREGRTGAHRKGDKRDHARQQRFMAR